MKYLKSFKFWVLFIIVSYTLLGFIFIPWFLTNKTAPIIKEKIGLNVQLGKAKFNPYTFRLTINNILLKDLSNKPALSIKKIFIDYAPIGLFNSTILFKNIEIDTPKLYASLNKNGKLNLENIVPKSNKIDKKEKNNTASSIVLGIYKFSIKNGDINFKDLRQTSPFSTNFGPINFMAHDISTRADDLNAYSFHTKVDKQGELSWEGGMRLSPLKIYGEITAKNIDLPKIYKYAISDIEAVLTNGKIDLNIPYQVDLTKNTNLSINGATISLSNIVFTNKTTKQSIVDIKNIAVDGIYFDLLNKSVNIDKATISKPNIFTLLNENADLTIAKAFTGKIKKPKTNSKKQKKIKWNFHLKEAIINDGIVTFIDDLANKQIPYNLSKTSLHVKNISLDNAMPITYTFNTTLNKKSQIDLQGSVTTKPFNLKSTINITNLNSIYFLEYIKPFINFKLKSASINAKTKIDLSYKDTLKVDAISDIDINNLLINTNDGNKLLAWKNLNIRALHYIHNPMQLTINSLNLNEPFIKTHIDEKGKINFAGLIKTSNTKEKSENNSSINIKIGPMKLVNGTSDFSDFSLPFPFKTHIYSLNGNFSELDLQSTTPANLKLTGQIDKYGYTDIQGHIIPLNITSDSSLNILFKNIDLTSLTPYSSKFIGYKIKQGKLSMDLKYRVKDSKLIGDNKINIDTLTLGETVKSPNATSLPLKLAIALLKDKDGQIDIDMPVKGDINDPDFSYGGVVWRALGNMITGIVTAPFRFLGSMLGVDGDKLKAIDFERGSFTLISTEFEKLENLAKILTKRPSIKLSIAGGYNLKVDTYELQKQKFKTLVNKKLKNIKIDTNETQNDIYGDVLKNMYITSFSNKQYEKLKKEFTTKVINKKDSNNTKKIKKKPVLIVDIISLNSKAQLDITKNIKIKKIELERLANKRANSIKKELVSKYKIKSEKITITPPEEQKVKRDRWIETILKIVI